jgi:predicted Rossmann-fold nucleotide-binding protein
MSRVFRVYSNDISGISILSVEMRTAGNRRNGPMQKQKRPQIPVVGLIGPTNLQKISRASGIPEDRYRNAAYGAGRVIARMNAILTIVPDRGVAVSGMRGYRESQGAWTVGLVPVGGPSDAVATPNCLENSAACDEVISGFTWHHQHAFICEFSNLLICVGLSCGTISEIAWTKWVRGPKVLIMRDTLTSIPTEITAETDIDFVDTIEELEMKVAGVLSLMASSVVV